MSLRLQAALRGRLDLVMAAELDAGKAAVTGVIARRTLKLKQDIRSTISGAGLGARLGNAVRSIVYPEGKVSLGAKGVVASNAIYKRPGGLVDLLTVFQEGATVRALGGRYLVIPLGAGKKESLAGLGKNVRLVPLRNGRGYLVFRKGAATGPLFLLLKEARIRPRFSIDALVEAAVNGMPEEIAAAWESEDAKRGLD